MTSKNMDSTAAAKAAVDAQVDAQELQKVADDVAANKSPEQKKAEAAAQKADDLKAKAAEIADIEGEAAKVPATVAQAAVLVVADPAMLASDHRAQKFGNDPANPKPAPGIDPNGPKVKLSRVTPDVANPVYIEVAKEMAGDYERAGWNRA